MELLVHYFWWYFWQVESTICCYSFIMEDVLWAQNCLAQPVDFQVQYTTVVCDQSGHFDYTQEVHVSQTYLVWINNSKLYICGVAHVTIAPEINRPQPCCKIIEPQVRGKSKSSKQQQKLSKVTTHQDKSYWVKLPLQKGHKIKTLTGRKCPLLGGY